METSAQEFVWAGQMGGPTDDLVNAAALDTAGNIYTVGYFTGTADFDPGPGTYYLSASSVSLFISKLDSAGGFVWARELEGGGQFGEAVGVAVDATGNVYAVGYFTGSYDFDPGMAQYDLFSAGGWDAFIAKFDSAGNFVWARRVGGTGNDGAVAVAVDSFGNVYTVGSFSATVDFDPGAGTSDLISAGLSDAFISKLDASGSFMWAKQLGGASGDGASGVALDSLGNIHTVGAFRDTVDFDPGAGTYNLTSAGGLDVFITKLDSSGNFVWASRLGGTADQYAGATAVDSSGNSYTVGSFEGTADFDPGAGTYDLTSAGSLDVYISKLDAAGNFAWARRMGGEFYDVATDMTVDPGGNVYTVGTFEGVVDFDPGPGTHNLMSTGSGFEEGFVSRLDISGDFAWAEQIDGIWYDWPAAVRVDAHGNVHVAGSFLETADFDPGPGTYELTPAGGFDAFLWTLSQACNYFSAGCGYGALVFAPLCTRDASELPGGPGAPYAYDSASLRLYRGPADRFYLSRSGKSLPSLVVDEAVRVNGQDSGLGPSSYQPGIPPFLIGVPIEQNLALQPPQEITGLITPGSSTVLFEAFDIEREIYGHTSVCLVRDCGIWLDEDDGGQATIHFVSYDVDYLGMTNSLNVATGLLSELQSDRDFTGATCLGNYPYTTQATDTRPDPGSGEGYYYLTRGTCSDPTYGDSNGPSPDPRRALDTLDPCV